MVIRQGNGRLDLQLAHELAMSLRALEPMRPAFDQAIRETQRLELKGDWVRVHSLGGLRFRRVEIDLRAWRRREDVFERDASGFAFLLGQL